MRRINILALIGMVFFNLVVFLGAACTVIALLFSLWVLIGSFVISPFLLLIVNVFGLQDFSIMQTLFSAVLLVVGIKLTPLANRLTVKTAVLFSRYFYWNKRAVLSE